MGEKSNITIKYVMFSDLNSVASAYYSVACVDKEGKEIEVIKDISKDKKAVEDFCELLNRNKISPVHFYDMFEDYFA